MVGIVSSVFLAHGLPLRGRRGPDVARD